MTEPRLSALIRSDKEYAGVIGAMREGLVENRALPLVVNGLSGGAQTAFLAEAVRDARAESAAPVLVLAGTDEECEKIASSLCLSGLDARPYRQRDLLFSNMSASHDTERERLSVLSALAASIPDAVVATPSAALSYTVPREMLASLSCALRVGDALSPEALTERLLLLHFSRTETVDGAGQFARRGGIVDFYPDAAKEPIRVEFFGDEIDRITCFDPMTQRASAPCRQVQLLPAGEVLLSAAAKERVLAAIEKLLHRTDDAQTVAALTREKQILTSGAIVDFCDKYLGVVYETQQNLLSYFSDFPRVVVFLLGSAAIREQLRAALSALDEQKAALLARGLVTQEAARYSGDEAEFDRFLAEHLPIHVNPFSGGLGSMRVAGLFGFRTRRTVAYGDNPAMLIEDVRDFLKMQYRLVLVCENKQGEQSLSTTLSEEGIAAAHLPDGELPSAENLRTGVVYFTLSESEGFDLVTPRVAVLSMKKDEGRAIMAHRRRQRVLRKSGVGERLTSYADLAVGDYVVHEAYGIGQFEGISTVRIDGIVRDYITIRYAGTDKLFVPCDRLEVIAKYIGEHADDGGVRLSHMGGGDWQKAKSRAVSAARDLAKKLIALYAERQRKPGFAFPAPTAIEREFADAFAYTETDAQLAAYEDIRADMQKPVPMNRLLCGDVGFGKTEVALRAAFKAILAGKQVAFLVPTTILALQHYQTALSRMRGYPVQIGMLSRFCTPKERAAILRRTARGEIDLLIGTHALLSHSLVFSDLGLLIVDEEQRFGVAQKEKLKEIAKNVDVLSMTATPIPRTLNMALTGISDISVLDEAPGDRRPVQTYVLEYDEVFLIEAMKKELARGGQVLYLCNRIEQIDFCAYKIGEAIPEARVAVAHGRKDKEEVEDIWQGLVRGEIDILVCTTIIETGIDLPNANTLIIENADRMGLAQLHQIRGRVGRSARQAYAYLTFRAGKALSEIAEKRLAAIREFAEFGAGFQIALRDLEIRGAGNLLGPEQHGYIESVGYDLYVRLLNEAVLEESGAKPTETFEATVEIRADANIPEHYIHTAAQRMEMYKKISLIRTEEDLSDVTDEFLDRFGEMPKATERLLCVSLIRALAARVKIRKVGYDGTYLVFSPEKPDLSIWSEILLSHPGLEVRSAPAVVIRLRARSTDEALALARKILASYAALLPAEGERSDPKDPVQADEKTLQEPLVPPQNAPVPDAQTSTLAQEALQTTAPRRTVKARLKYYQKNRKLEQRRKDKHE